MGLGVGALNVGVVEWIGGFVDRFSGRDGLDVGRKAEACVIGFVGDENLRIGSFNVFLLEG